jgi:DNA-binding transcriptional LysR family regulator
MEIQQLRGFVEVARERSFTKAARKLFVTQPAVSLQIKALEEEFGQVLIERSGRELRLTSAGEILYRRAITVMTELNTAREELEGLNEVVRGRVVVGTSDTYCTYILPEVLEAFRLAHPEVSLEIRNKMSSEVGQLVLEDRADLGLATLPVGHRSLHTEVLFDRRDALICQTEHPLATRKRVCLQTVAAQPLLVLEQGSRSRELLEHAFRESGLHLEALMDLGSIEVIKRFVEIGFGVAVVPLVAVQREVSEGRLAAVPIQGLPARPVGIVTHRGRSLSAAALAFLELLKNKLSGKEL